MDSEKRLRNAAVAATVLVTLIVAVAGCGGRKTTNATGETQVTIPVAPSKSSDLTGAYQSQDGKLRLRLVYPSGPSNSVGTIFEYDNAADSSTIWSGTFTLASDTITAKVWVVASKTGSTYTFKTSSKGELLETDSSGNGQVWRRIVLKPAPPMPTP